MTAFSYLKFTVLTFLFFATAHSQSELKLQKDWHQTNGFVQAIAEDTTNNVVYIGGDFSAVGPTQQGIALVNSSNGTSSVTIPSTNYTVSKVISDGNGGWFIGGTFTQIGDYQRNGLAHINSQGEVTAWNPDANGGIFDMVLEDNILYVCGSFTSIGGNTINKIARISAITGSASQMTTVTGNVVSLALTNDYIYLAGGFSEVGGEFRSNLARLDKVFCIVDSWTVPVSGGGINQCTIIDNTLIIGGDFSVVGSSNRQRIASINIPTSSVNSWNPGANNFITCLKAVDTMLYVGGNFSIVGGQSRTQLASFNIQTGALTAWNPIVNSTVHCIEIYADTLYVGGGFTTINSVPRQRAAAINRFNSTVYDWDPSMNEIVTSILRFNGQLFLTGNFSSFNQVSRKYFAALNAQTGELLPFSLNLDGNITALDVANEHLYLGGNFSTINGITRSHLGSIDLINETVTSWNPNPNAPGSINRIIHNDTALFIAGYYSNIAGMNRNGVSSFNLFNQSINTWNPNPNVGAYLFELFIEDTTIYLGGHFNTIGGLTRNNFAQVSLLNGTCGSLLASTNNNVFTIELIDNNIYLGGAFTTINGQNRSYAGAVDCSNGNLLSWEPGINNFINGIVKIDSDYAFIGGNFYLNQSSSLVSNLQTGFVSPQDLRFNNTRKLFKSPGRILHGGGTSSINGFYNMGLGTLKICSPTETQINVSSDTPYYWSVDQNTYSCSGAYSHTLVDIYGCDSTVILNLTITSSPIENTFSLPSDPNNCVGEFAVDLSGNGDFELDVDNGAQTATSSGYSLFTGLCPGVHDLQIVNSCGDTTTTQFVIPVDTNYVFTNPFIDSLAQDSLGTTIEDCDIYYAGIDTAYIDSIWATGNTVNVIWNIVDSNGSNLDTTSYELNNGNGVYWLQLSVFCPTKALGDYFTVTESIYFEDGTISTAGIGDWQETDILIYPNPTNNLVTVSFEGNKAELTIYDSQGKVIQNRSSIHSVEHVSLKDIQTGVYFFEIVTDEGKAVKRVVKN